MSRGDARILARVEVTATLKKADGRVIALGNVSNPSLATRWKLFKLRARARKDS